MFRALLIGSLAFVAGLALPTNSHAAGTTYAVVVGIGTYNDPQIQPRVHAVDDAQAMYDLFVDPKTLGAPADQVQLLLSGTDEKRHAKPATRENILAAVKAVVAKANKEDTVLFAFFAQGAALAEMADSRTCILTSDATYKDRTKLALATPDLEKELEPLKAEKVVAFMDIGFKGIDPGKEALLEPNPLDPLRAFVGGEDKEEHTVPPGRVFFVASTFVTEPIELKDHGLFAQIILDGLKGDADTTGYEADGVVTIDELAKYLDNKSLTKLRESGKVIDDKKIPIPLVFGIRNNEYAVTHNPAVYGTAHERVEKFAKLPSIPTEVAAEGEKLLSKMPRLKADQDLRKLYQQAADGKLSTEDLLAARTKNYDGRKLPAADAQRFARRVVDGIGIIHSGFAETRMDAETHVRKTEPGFSQKVAWVIKGMYKRLDEKLPDDLKALVGDGKKPGDLEREDKAKDWKRSKLEEILADVRTRFGQREDLEGNKDVDLAMTQIMFNLDFPYSMYIDKESKDKAEIDFRGRFTGIGIQIRRELARDGLLVVSPIKDSPGYKAGLKAGDLVVEITTEMDEKGRPQPTQQVISTKGMRTEDAVKRILGKPGTPVKVKVQREGVDKLLEFEILRGRVEVETCLGARRKDDDTWDYMLDPVNKIGYIRLTQFIDRSAADVETAVRRLVADGMRGLIFDLRGNPGGLLESAVAISDMFIDSGKIVGIRRRGMSDKDPEWIEKETRGGYHNFPIAVMVNGHSASGSEIVAACLQDHGRAVIVGERSFGKGSVQTIHQFRPVDAEIKMTTATFWRPSEQNLNKPSTSGKDEEVWGVKPNDRFELKLDMKERIELAERMRDHEIIPRRDAPPAKEPKPQFKDRQLEMGLDYLKSQIKTAVAPPAKKAG